MRRYVRGVQSTHKIPGSSATPWSRYLVSQATRGDYYTHDGQDGQAAPTQWHGPEGLLRSYGIDPSRPVELKHLRSLMHGYSPVDGEPIRPVGSNGTRVAGIDLTFSPPKSVSALWATAGPYRRAQIEVAHRRAVKSALERTEREVALVRRKRDGVVRFERADRLLAVKSLHTTSRLARDRDEQGIPNLGADSPAFALDLDELRDLYIACRTDPEVQLKRELWGRLLIAALGTNFEDSDELFVTHTYLVLTAELIAHAVARVSLDDVQDVRALLEGQQFQLAGLHGVVEADFFDWPARRPEGERVVRAIVRRLVRFDWSTVEHDILKALYESVIDAETRHKLGEYYTPDWLAQRMVEQNVADPLNERVLDPACGSGTFLFWAVRHVLQAADREGLSNREALELVVNRVSGIDLHPVVVTLARVTYLLAIGHNRLGNRNELTIPVFLGDSVRWDHDTDLFQSDGITIHTSENIELFAQDLHFPETVLEDPARFDRLVAALADRAASRPPASRRKTAAKKSSGQSHGSIVGVMNAHKVAEVDRQAVELVFEKLCRLHDAGRNHVWGYYIRNLARPLSFARAGAQADVLIGNPPWLAYRHMSETLQTRYQQLAKARGLWSGGRFATHQDLSDLFVARAVEQYLRLGGRFAFVMPFAVLSRRQYAGFRSGDFTSHDAGVQAVAFERPEEFARIKPPLFLMPSCVVSGTRSPQPAPMPSGAVRWTGHVSDHHLGWEAISGSLHSEDGVIQHSQDAEVSPYREHFRQGATVVPRVLLTVQPAPTPAVGLPVGRRAVRSLRSAVEKPPWKELRDLTGIVEEQFVYPMHLGATMVAYRSRDPWLAVIPYDGTRLLSGDDDTLDEYPGLAEWWRTLSNCGRTTRRKGRDSRSWGELTINVGSGSSFPLHNTEWSTLPRVSISLHVVSRTGTPL